MSLLKELHSISEDATRTKIVDMILNYSKKVDKSHFTSDANLAKIIKSVRDQDDEGITKNFSDEALEQLIRLHVEPTLEAVSSDEDDAASEEPRLLVKAGEFKVMLYPEEQIKIVDNSDKIRLEMPLVIWKQLARG